MSGGFDYSSYLMFNPEGRVKQLEFVKQTADHGSTCVALRGRSAAVLIAHRQLRSKLAEPQQKIFPIHDRALFAFAGITNDGLAIVNYLKTVALSERVMKDRPLHYFEAFTSLRVDAASRTATGNARLFGVEGLLVAEHPTGSGHGAEEGTAGESGAALHIMHIGPTGELFECHGMAIGHRAQSCTTVLEDACDDFADADVRTLIQIGIQALRNAYPDRAEEVMQPENIQIVVLELGNSWREMDAAEFLSEAVVQ